MTRAIPEVTACLASYIHSTRLSDIPEDVRAQARLAISDSLATLIAGLQEPSVRLLREVISLESRDGGSSVLGCNRQLSATGASFINAATAHALDYDNISLIVSGFVGTPVLFSLLALAEQHGIGGQKLLEAYIVGWETESAIARGVGVAHYAGGWHATATLGHFGAAAACAKLLDFNERQIRYALGFAATDASGIRTMTGNMTNPYHLGKAARCGPLATALIERGFTAHEAALENDWGFCNAFNGQGNYDLNAIVEAIGSPYDLVFPGLVIKMYPCCALIHSTLDGVADLMREHNLKPAQVKRARIAVHDLVLKTMDRPRPATAYEGKFCAPFCVALGIRNGGVRLKDFSDASIVDPEILGLMDRIEVKVHPDLTTLDTFLEREFSDVAFDLMDGRTVSCRVWRVANRGSRGRPATAADMQAKFADAVADYGQRQQALDALESVARIEDMADIRSLTGALRGV